MAYGPITAQEVEGKMEVVTDFLFLGSKITADGDCRPWNQKMIASW